MGRSLGGCSPLLNLLWIPWFSRIWSAFLSEPLEFEPIPLTAPPSLESPPDAPLGQHSLGPQRQPIQVSGSPFSSNGQQLSDVEQEAYQLLEVPVWASASELQAAYRHQMQQIHPDRLPANTPMILRASAEREFRRLQDAYRLLLTRTAISAQSNGTGDPLGSGPESPDIDRDGPADLRDQEQGSPPSAVPVPLPTEPAGLPLPAQLPTWLGSPTSRGWLAVGGGGAVLGFVLGIATLSLSRTPAPISTLATVTLAEDISPTAAEIVLPPSSAPDSLPVASSAPDRIRLAQIDRFALILQELRPHMARADQDLALATDSAERAAIEAEFNRLARPIIESYGLEPEEYQRIAQLSQENAEIAEQIVEAAQRLQLRQPPVTE
ncbi:MAG: DnaJ domain-containing protein [Synechococcaceae cyanobacterium RM1_1_27]|nr:DnaJ domain-containing protein [Synechococcaceae cyanobacterium RM1_1_27]